jgi:hypothetical protein
MRSFRKAIIGLVLFLTVFFNIERLDFGSENIINFNTFVYIITISAILLVIIIKDVATIPLLIGHSFWFLIYFFIKFIYFKDQLVFVDKSYIYLTIAELLFLYAGLTLGRYTSKLLSDLESTVENMSLVGTEARIKHFGEASEAIQVEMYRTRRFNSPLSVITIGVEKGIDEIVINDIVKEMQNDILKHYSLFRLAKLIHNLTRTTDIVLLKQAEDQLVLLAPQTGKEGAIEFIKKFRKETLEKFNIEFPFSIKTFPDDGHTFEDLYNLSAKDLFEKRKDTSE